MAVIPATVGLMSRSVRWAQLALDPRSVISKPPISPFNGNGGTFLLDFLTSASFATGFDSAALNGNLLINSRFSNT